MHLLPEPKSIATAEGTFPLGEETRIFLPPGLERPEWLAVERLRREIGGATGAAPVLDRAGNHVDWDQPAVFLAIEEKAGADDCTRQGYRLEVRPDAVRLAGHSAEGLHNGIRTLCQIARGYGRKLPACTIDDQPDFAVRGFYHDVSRGKVPHLETLFWLVDYLAEWKINQFQLYVEHPYAFRFDPEIAQNPDGLTPDEILALQEYCRDHRIDFVPSLQSFGHMAGVLCLPQYRHLADVELQKPWKELTWRERMVGATIDMNNPEALALLEKMHDHFLPLFDSPLANVCADETYALGKGKNKELAEKEGTGRLYLRHIAFLNDLMKKYGKRMMFWGDIVKKHPDLIPEIPKEAILMNWGYTRDTDYESTKLFVDTGLDVYVCPGANGWNQLLNGFNTAEMNIRDYAAAGKKYGAVGLLNTDWGDCGHVNLLSASLHGIALGGAAGWQADVTAGERFDKAWEALFLGFDGQAMAALRKACHLADFYPTWTLFYQPITDTEALAKITDEEAQQTIETARDAMATLDGLDRTGRAPHWVLEELLHSCRMMVLFGERVLLVRKLAAAGGKPDEKLRKELLAFAEKLEDLHERFEELWRARNKESELGDIRRCMAGLVREARDAAGVPAAP